MSKELAPDEAVEADGVYNLKEGVGAKQLKRPAVGWESKERKQKALARSRNENINGKLKVFNVLTTFFRHCKPRNKMMEKHGMCFNAVAVITQLKMEAGESLNEFNEYNVNYF